jgi:mannan endo-1,4-beta-mannosidase
MAKRFVKFAMALSVVSLSACASQKATDSVQTPAESLRARLAQVVDSGKVIFGHHDDTAYGHTWRYIDGRSDVKDVAGDYPGLMNWDLGLIEHQSSVELDSVPFDFIRQEVAKQDLRGGINSFSWHPRNPKTGGDSWDTSYSPVHEMVTPGTALNDTICLWVDRAADFILSLKDAKGNRIPVMFRPWHEHTGTWFWWGKDYCSPADYKALWQLTFDRFAAKGVDNVVWVYSPDKLTSAEEYEERYPGDKYVDILGTDAYQFNGAEGIEEYKQRASRQLDAALALAQKSGKLIALSETGLESVTVDDWWTNVLLPICERYPIAYVCVWRNAHNRPEHFYAPFPGHSSAKSFIEFYKDNHTLFAGDLLRYK